MSFESVNELSPNLIFQKKSETPSGKEGVNSDGGAVSAVVISKELLNAPSVQQLELSDAKAI